MSVPRTRAFAAVAPLPRTISTGIAVPRTRTAVPRPSATRVISTDTNTDTGTGTGTDTTVHIDAGQHLDVDTKHPLTHTSTPRTSGTS
ncbi:hypothetical protein CP966_05375 [Streptomyces galilaeus]|uniref:hypothetical protein n=1 Tax=Streptomyces galilaeus TaxID=33899 RepID=UPI00123E3E1A|nr:hypothetical protein [Streptomyces galilaeus]QEU64750.1 hypothetical protein CP966_05375 [Streptomyces galilaeus]GGW65729.1 hypothetical protein GCM10010350_57880 [Streptomyces galilaeus]